MKAMLKDLLRLSGHAVLVAIGVSGCIYPVFEDAEVEKGIHGWAGAVGGYRCFDWNGDYDSEQWEDTRGVVACGGFNQGLNDNIAWFVHGTLYFVDVNDYYYYGYSRRLRFLPDLTFGLKYEFTSSSSPLVFSISGGSSFPAVLKLRPMLGIRHNKQEIIAVGVHFTPGGLLNPADIFVTIHPKGHKGLALYIGHRAVGHPHGHYTSRNIALGIGYQW